MIYTALAYGLVWPLKAVTPLCFIGLPLSFFQLDEGIIKSALLAYTATEVGFYFWFRRALSLAQVRLHPPATTRARRDEIWKGISDSSLEGESPYDFLKFWFSASTLARVSRNDLKQWLAWALFDRQYDEIVSPDARAELDERIAEGESVFAITIPDQAEEELPAAMRLNVDPVLAEHRPLVYYAVTGLIGLGADVALAARGFRHNTVGPVNFWVLASANTSQDGGSIEPPLVFVHGVGIGLATYLPFILKLSSDRHRRGRSIVLIDLPHVAMKLGVATIPRMDVIADCAAIIFKQYNLAPAVWAAHSLGTFVFAVVNRLQPQLVSSVVLVDPVCFLLWEPDLLKNFCYREPVSPMEIIQSYHICRELSISYFFHRHFWWHECVQFAQDLPSKSIVFISEFDGIYNTIRVRAHLESKNISTKLFKGHTHGGWLMESAATERILAAL